MRRTCARARQFNIEQLESRQMLSGAPPVALDESYEVGPINPLVIDSVMDRPGAVLLSSPIPQYGYSGGSSIIPQQFLMQRFLVSTSDPVRAVLMHGHFGGFEGGNIFGAIVALDGPDDVPDSTDLSTPDVLGTALLPVHDPSTLTSGVLSVELSPGYYAAVFGTGRFGATANGFAPTVDAPGSSFYFTNAGGWSTQPNHNIAAFVDAVGVIGGVLANDRDPEGDALSATLAAGPAHGTLNLQPDGRFTYDPDAGFEGIDSFRYVVSDGTSQRTATAYIGVSGSRPENPPVTRQDTYFLPGGSTYEGSSVLANDTGIELRAQRVTGPAHGTLELRADGTFRYTPNVGFAGEDRFYYRAAMGTLESPVAAVFLNVAPINDAPIAKDDVYRIKAGESLMSGMRERLASSIYFTDEGLLSLNKAPLDGGTYARIRSLTFSASSIALDLEHNMVYWYIGAPEYRIYRAPLSGGPQQSVVQMPEVEYTWQGNIGHDNPSVRDMAIDVAGGKLYWTTNSVQNVYPAKVSRSNLDGTNVEDLWSQSPFGFPQGIDLDLKARKVYWTSDQKILRTDMDADGPRTVETVVASAPGGGDIPALALDVSRGKVFWAEGQIFSSARIRSANLDGSSAETVLTLDRDTGLTDMAIDPARGKLYWADYWFDTINRVNLDGSGREVVLRNGLTNPYGFTLDQVFPDNYIYGVLANDSDLDGDALTATVVGGPGHGRLELAANGSFKYVPEAGFVGKDSFTYTASDGQTQSAPATVTIFVGNLAPVANADEYETAEDTVLDVGAANGVLANDVDEEPGKLRAVLDSGPSHGTVELGDRGQFVYRPAANFFGDDTFTYRANDGELLSSPAAVTIHVTAVNDAPIANLDFKQVDQDHTLTFPASDLTANDFDADGDALAVTGVNANDETHGTVALTGGTITYTPAAGFAGLARFEYTIIDGHGGEATGTVEVTVRPLVHNTEGKVDGHGSLDNGRRQFNFQVQSRMTAADFAIQGHLTFTDLRNRIAFRSTRITAFEINANGRLASFSGVGMFNGRLGYAFTVHIEDNAGPNRGRDRFRIEITGRGVDYDSLDFATNGGRIDRIGDIRVQPRRNTPAPTALARGVLLAGWANSGRYETLVEQLARARAAE